MELLGQKTPKKRYENYEEKNGISLAANNRFAFVLFFSYCAICDDVFRHSIVVPQSPNCAPGLQCAP